MNVDFVCFEGEGTAGEGHLWDVRPLCEGDAPAGQETPPGDQDQATHTESALERDILFRRSVLSVWIRDRSLSYAPLLRQQPANNSPVSFAMVKVVMLLCLRMFRFRS